MSITSEELWNDIKKIGEVKKRDMGAFATIKRSGMRFDLTSYEWNGIGYLSTIETKGFLGLMKMESLIFTPLEMDVPLPPLMLYVRLSMMLIRICTVRKMS